MEITAAYRALLEGPMETPPGAEAARAAGAPQPPAAATSQGSIPVGRDWRLHAAAGAAALALILSFVWWLTSTGAARLPDVVSGTEPLQEAAVERNARPASSSERVPANRESAPRSGAGEIRITNQTNSAAVLRISTTGAKDRILNTSTVPAGDIAILSNLAPESYIVEATFSGQRSAPLRLGPFDILQITTGGTVEADRYDVTLRPRAAR